MTASEHILTLNQSEHFPRLVPYFAFFAFLCDLNWTGGTEGGVWIMGRLGEAFSFIKIASHNTIHPQWSRKSPERREMTFNEEENHGCIEGKRLPSTHVFSGACYWYGNRQQHVELRAMVAWQCASLWGEKEVHFSSQICSVAGVY